MMIQGNVNSYLSFGIKMFSGMKAMNEQKLREIEDEWHRSKNYPRKKKKAVRKRLLVEYSIFSYAKNIFT